MKRMKTLVVDDEPTARNGLCEVLSVIDSVELCGEAYSAKTFLEKAEELQPDLIFLDLMLRDINSLNLVSKLSFSPLLIITTAFDQHALQGYQLKAVDYLLKPLAPNHVYQAVERANTLFLAGNTQSNTLYLKSNGKYIRFKSEEILFVKGMENYVVVQTKEDKLICKMTMTQLFKNLPDHQFLQIHKSYIINVDKIDAIEKHQIYMESHVVPISRERKNQVYKMLFGT